MRLIKRLFIITTLLIVSFVIINFIAITDTIYEIQNHSFTVEKVDENAFSQRLKNKKADIYFTDCSVKVFDCNELSKDERIEVASFIIYYLKMNNIYYDRTLNNFVAELSLHSYLAKIGIEKSSTVDADLEFICDSRWYVKTGTTIFQILGI